MNGAYFTLTQILEIAAITGLVVVTTGFIPTFQRPGYEGSIPQIAFVSESPVSLVDEWRVLKYFSASGHQYITFEVADRNSRRSLWAWNVVKVNTGRFFKTLAAGGAALEGTPGGGNAAAGTS